MTTSDQTQTYREFRLPPIQLASVSGSNIPIRRTVMRELPDGSKIFVRDDCTVECKGNVVYGPSADPIEVIDEAHRLNTPNNSNAPSAVVPPANIVPRSLTEALRLGKRGIGSGDEDPDAPPPVPSGMKP